MDNVTERTPGYDPRTDSIAVCVNGVTYCWLREHAESLFESLRVGLQEAALYQQKIKETSKAGKSETIYTGYGWSYTQNEEEWPE